MKWSEELRRLFGAKSSSSSGPFASPEPRVYRQSARPQPTERPQKPAKEFVTAVVGESFPNDDGISRQSLIALCKSGDNLSLAPEPSNPYDKNAVKVLSRYGQIGYLKSEVAARFCRDIRSGMTADGVIERIEGGDEYRPSRGAWIKIRMYAPQ